MAKRSYIKLVLLLLMPVLLQAQGNRMAYGDKQFNKFAYVDAIKTYERLAEKGFKSPVLFQKLGDSYYFRSDYAGAVKWYNELFTLTTEAPAEYYYRYSQSLKAMGDYEKAHKMLEVFTQKSADELRTKLYKDNKDYLSVIKRNSGRYEVKKTAINSVYSDYGPAFYQDKLVFTSERDTVGLIMKKDKWTSHSFTAFYEVPVNKKGNLGEVRRFSRKIDTKYHESTPAFTQDGKTMYFTRNNYNKGKLQRNEKGHILLKIYKSTLKDEKWTDVVELPFNSNEYSVAHPALSPDGKTLYFASNMPGTLGESDIFKVTINGDGTFGTPVNLGSGINTEGKDTFPFIASNGMLYFASEGHPGLGGLDIFIARPEPDGSFKEAYNVGEAVNSNKDDFAFIFNNDSKIGFFSSNRDGGQGFDDIYSFIETKEFEFKCKQLLSGIVTDEDTGEVFSDAKVSLFDADFNPVGQFTTSADGAYSFDVECGKSYYVRSEKENYLPKEVNVVIQQQPGETKLPIAQEQPVQKMQVGSDLAKAFNIQDIYFDLGKYDIRPDAAIDLQKIINFMNEYPTAKIDVRSHTDCRASDKFNDKLSGNRAKSIMDYLVKNGISRSRLTGRGYGERRLINKCADGVQCTEEEHQQNRRSEFIITAI